ncbi:MAG: molybdopterin-dependent oxidoreductase, partial [Armatimonadetes bacterium]|nr:molybdopterin-dependent oxidoreductase [Armatimonadota bacterium]
VKTPSLRSPNGSSQPIEVSQAIKLIIERLQSLRDRYGSEVIGILGSARLTNEENRLIRQLAVALGTPHLDSFQRLGYLPLGSVGLESLEEASKINVLSVDLAHRFPQVFKRVSKALKRGTTVRFIDSRQVQLAKMATEHVRPMPGQELNALTSPDNGEVVLVSSEIALHGQGAKTVEALQGRKVMFLTDYVNQRGMIEAGVRPFPGGASAYEMLQRALTGDLKALLVFADDPFEFFPELATKAFSQIDFVVVVDSVETRAMKYAHVVLPGALLAEKQGTFTNCEGRVQILEPVAPPLAGLTERHVLEEMLRLLGEIPESSDVAPFSVNSMSVEPESPTVERPFIVALDSGTFWNNHALSKASITVWREMRRPFVDFPNGYVLVNPVDARELGIRMFTPVRMESEEGEITLPANIDERASRGTLLVPMFLWEKVGTALGALQFDTSLRIPVFRPTAVKIVK